MWDFIRLGCVLGRERQESQYKEEGANINEQFERRFISHQIT